MQVFGTTGRSDSAEEDIAALRDAHFDLISFGQNLMEIAGGVASIFHCATKLEEARVVLAKARGIGKSDPGTATLKMSDAVHKELKAVEHIVKEAQDFMEIEDHEVGPSQ